MKRVYPDRHSAQRRGGVVVLVAVSLTVIIGFAALAIDLGRLYVTRTELQRAADAAALAGVSSFFTDVGLSQDPYELSATVVERTQRFSLQNPTLGAGTILDPADVVIGTHDFDYPHAPLDTSGVQPFNAVQVTVRRAPGSFNGPVAFLFARIFGETEGGLSAQATAAVDDRFAGVRTEEIYNTPFVPFSMRLSVYDDMTVNGGDDYGYDDGVYSGSDGIPEVDFYPWSFKTNNVEDPADDTFEVDGAASGNWGLLEFGGGGAAATADQILNGISPADLEATVGTSELVFCDEAGNPVTYTVPGLTGMKVSIVDALEQRIGDAVGIFVHGGVTGTGAGAEYLLVQIRYVRIMACSLKSNPADRHLIVQPVAYTGSEVIIREYADSTDRQVGRMMLVK